MRSPRSYDNGVTGGVVGMPDFLEKFFPSVLADVEAGGKSACIALLYI